MTQMSLMHEKNDANFVKLLSWRKTPFEKITENIFDSQNVKNTAEIFAHANIFAKTKPWDIRN